MSDHEMRQQLDLKTEGKYGMAVQADWRRDREIINSHQRVLQNDRGYAERQLSDILKRHAPAVDENMLRPI